MSAWQQSERLYKDCLRNLAEGEVEAAEELALRRWELSPDEDAARLLSVTYLLQGRYQAALDVSQVRSASAR